LGKNPLIIYPSQVIVKSPSPDPWGKKGLSRRKISKPSPLLYLNRPLILPVELVLSVAQVHFQLILHWEEELNGDKKLIR
jgi:hypothetical protein